MGCFNFGLKLCLNKELWIKATNAVKSSAAGGSSAVQIVIVHAV